MDMIVTSTFFTWPLPLSDRDMDMDMFKDIDMNEHLDVSESEYEEIHVHVNVMLPVKFHHRVVEPRGCPACTEVTDPKLLAHKPWRSKML